MSRLDGRSENTLRPLSCELGSLHNCDGSAIWKSGSTAVLAAVHGPIAPRQASHESSAGCVVSLVIKTNATNASSSNQMYDPEWEDFLTQQLAACIVTESYPRCVISIVLQILNADGSVLAVALHAAVSALMDAGIDMHLLPTAVTCSCASDGSMQLDPSYEEEQSSQGVIVFVFSPDQSHGMLGCYTTASLQQSTVQLLQCCSTCQRAVPAIQAFWRLAMEKVAQQVCRLKATAAE
jgi:exosome complex component RRP46